MVRGSSLLCLNLRVLCDCDELGGVCGFVACGFGFVCPVSVLIDIFKVEDVAGWRIWFRDLEFPCFLMRLQVHGSL